MKLGSKSKYLFAALTGLALSAVSANAQINLLWQSTGTQTTPVLLPGPVPAGVTDNNYSYRGTTTGFNGVVGGFQNQAVLTVDDAFPFGTGAWTANTAFSRWLQPGTSGSANSNTPLTYFAFQTTFNFNASIYNLATSSFGISTTADNQLQLFGGAAGTVAIGAPGAIDNFTIDAVDNFTYSIGTGLVAGLNTINIVVFNAAGNAENFNNPAGFRLQVTERLTPFVPVPEPSTYGLMGAAALFGIIAVRRFRNKSVKAV
jgi:PEP-CTERM motif